MVSVHGNLLRPPHYKNGVWRIYLPWNQGYEEESVVRGWYGDTIGCLKGRYGDTIGCLKGRYSVRGKGAVRGGVIKFKKH